MSGSLFLATLGVIILVFGEWNLARAWRRSRNNWEIQKDPFAPRRGDSQLILVPVIGYSLLVVGVVALVVR